MNAANRSCAIVLRWLFGHVFVYCHFLQSLSYFYSLFIFLSWLCFVPKPESQGGFYEPPEEVLAGLAFAVKHLSTSAVSTMGQFC